MGAFRWVTLRSGPSRQGRAIQSRSESRLCRRGNGFAPHIRLFASSGGQLVEALDGTLAQINLTIPTSGTYSLVVGDGNGQHEGSGPYRLTVEGIIPIPQLAAPVSSPDGAVFAGTGGEAGATYVLLTSTNISQPASLWTPILTNRFGPSGEFSLTNTLSTNLPGQYFQLRVR